jgi:hypothetical protein
MRRHRMSLDHKATSDAVPDAQGSSDNVERSDNACCQPSGRLIVGVIIILLGFGFLLQEIFGWFNFDYIWALALIAAGLFIIFRRPR